MTNKVSLRPGNKIFTVSQKIGHCSGAKFRASRHFLIQCTVASKDSTGAVHISLVNLDAHKDQELTIDLGSLTPQTVTGRMLHSNKIQDYNSFENPTKIQPELFRGAVVKGNKLSLTLPPFSVVVLELK